MRVPCRRGLLIAAASLGCLVVAGWLSLQLPAVRGAVRVWASARVAERFGPAASVQSVRLALARGAVEVEQVEIPAAHAQLHIALLRIHWNWASLLSGHLEPQSLVLIRPVLEVRGAWTDAASARPRALEPRGDGAARRRMPVIEIIEGTVRHASGFQTAQLAGVLRWNEEQQPAFTVRADDVSIPMAGTRRELHRLLIDGALRDNTLVVQALQASASTISLSGHGQVRQLWTSAEIDMQAAAVLPVEGQTATSAAVAGRITGTWPALAFAGELRLTAGSGTDAAPVTATWKDGRVAVEIPASTVGLSGRGEWASDTGRYQAQFKLQGVDVARIAASRLLARVNGRPAPVAGRMFGDGMLTGQGSDLASLRGTFAVRIEQFTAGTLSGQLEGRGTASTSGIILDEFRLAIPGGTVQGRGTAWQRGALDLTVSADVKDTEDFARTLALPAAKGAVTFQGRVAGDWQLPRWHGRIAWRQPEFSFGAFDAIEADVDAAERTLTFSRLLVRLGSTAATLRGTVTATGNQPLTQVERTQLALDLQGQIASGRIIDLRPFLAANFEVRGAFRADGQITGTAAAPRGAVEIRLTNPEIYGEAWQTGEAALRLLSTGYDVPRFTLSRGSEQVSGAIRFGADGTLGGSLEAVNLDLSRMELTARAGVVGRAAATLALQGTVADPRAIGPINCQALTIADVPLGAVNGTVALSRAGTDLNLSLQRDAVRAHLVVGPFGRRNPQLRLVLQDADLDPLLRATSLEIPRGWQPHGTGEIEVRGLADSFAATAGEARLSAARVQIGAETWKSAGTAELTWRDGTLTVRPVRLTSGVRDLTIGGTIGEGGQAALDINGRMPVAALPADLPGIHPLGGTAEGKLHVAGALPAPIITGQFVLAEGRFQLGESPAALESVQAQVDVAAGHAVVKNVRGRWAGGSIAADGDVTYAEGRWNLRATVQVDNSRLEQLVTSPQSPTTGAISLRGSVSSHGRSEQDFWQNLAGSVQVVARDGGMGKQGFIVRVLSLANLGQIFTVRDLDLSAPTIPFRQLSADFVIERGIGRTENCLLEARAFNASAVGKVDVASQYVEMEVAIKPFQTLNLLGEVPVAGWLLTGKDRSLVTGFYAVSGPLANPTVRPLAVKNIDENVFGIFKRVLRLPTLLQGREPE